MVSIVRQNIASRDMLKRLAKLEAETQKLGRIASGLAGAMRQHLIDRHGVAPGDVQAKPAKERVG